MSGYKSPGLSAYSLSRGQVVCSHLDIYNRYLSVKQTKDKNSSVGAQTRVSGHAKTTFMAHADK